MRLLLIVVCVVTTCRADVYLHNPRGSNNRMTEKNAQRDNANRLFDSQNNNNGGYNIGDKEDRPQNEDYRKQFHMKYFMSDADHLQTDGRTGTNLRIQWTNQHGCGGTEGNQPQENMFCQLILQFMCRPSEDQEEKRDEVKKANDDLADNDEKEEEEEDDDEEVDDEVYRDFARRDKRSSRNSPDGEGAIRDGVDSDTQDYKPPNGGGRRRRRRRRRTPVSESKEQFEERKDDSIDSKLGLHEQFEWYDKCTQRERNKGLFTADQKLKKDTSEHTRQNNNGNRYGYECPEERDYYPYWHPTEWKDIAIMGENIGECKTYEDESFNVKPRGECVEKFSDGSVRHYSKYNHKESCEANGGDWLEFHNYLEKAPQHKTKAACEAASGNGINYIWKRPINMGNGVDEMCLVALDKPKCMQAPYSRDNHLGNGDGNKGLFYDWELPFFPSLQKQTCVLRLRYNISTNDFDPKNTFAEDNDVIENDPDIDTGKGFELQLAINTAQFARTFEDRSHMFHLEARPEGAKGARIHNLNVRGKRGNIQQVQNAVEYDFYPRDLVTKENDLIHVQWAGSNTHDNNGQGDDGEGRGGTDRSNIYQIENRNVNRAGKLDDTNMFSGAKVIWSPFEKKAEDMTSMDIAVTLATAGYYECATGCRKRPSQGSTVDDQLDNAPASFAGLLVKMAKGIYHYMCTRNNNFTNRSQKGTITVAGKSRGNTVSTVDDQLDNARPSFKGALVALKKKKVNYHHMLTWNNNFSNRSQKGTITVAGKSGGNTVSGVSASIKKVPSRRVPSGPWGLRGDAVKEKDTTLAEIQKVADDVIEEEREILKILNE